MEDNHNHNFFTLQSAWNCLESGDSERKFVLKYTEDIKPDIEEYFDKLRVKADIRVIPQSPYLDLTEMANIVDVPNLVLKGILTGHMTFSFCEVSNVE
ncbi:MAG: hypothetical protein WED06_00755 [Candidatus Paceibacterota bacterium]